LAPRPEHADVDESGRLVPETDEERRLRAGRILAALDRIETMTDATDTEERWREIMRHIDEGRPQRPLFAGQY
jgi:hypothetical protein